MTRPERHANAGAKSDTGDAHALADMLRTDGHQLRAIAGDSALAAGLKVMARAHQSLIWERARHTLRLRAGLREYFPAAVAAFDELAAVDTLELLAKAPDPASAARLTRPQLEAALRRAHRHGVAAKAVALQAALRVPGLTQPAPVTAAFAAVTQSLVAVIAVINHQIAALGATLAAEFDTHPDAAIYRSQPGLGPVLATRALAEFGDDPDRYASARARKNYAATSPITRQSGKKKTVTARYVHNDRLVDALIRQAQGGAGQLTRSSALLRRTPGSRSRALRGPAATRQPTRSHPARLPQDQNPLRRDRRLGPPISLRRGGLNSTATTPSWRVPVSRPPGPRLGSCRLRRRCPLAGPAA